MKRLYILLIYLFSVSSISQHEISISINLDTINNSLDISQQVILKYKKKFDTIYLIDWNNSFKSNKSELGKRFIEEYSKSFYFAKKEQKGSTTIKEILSGNGEKLNHFRETKFNDIIGIVNNGRDTLNLNYRINIPSDKFTGYGYSKIKEYSLQYWMLTPANYNKNWIYYDNKNLNDIPNSKFVISSLELKTPINYNVFSDLDKKIETINNGYKKVTKWSSNYIKDPKIYINKNNHFNITNLNSDTEIFFNKNAKFDLDNKSKKESDLKVLNFINSNINFDNTKFIISESDYKNNKIYDLSFLPKIIKIYPEEFIYEMSILKILLNKILNNRLNDNPRKDYWYKDGIQIYFLIRYVEEYYSDLKLAGNLSELPALKKLYASKISYNDKYKLGIKHMYRLNNYQNLDIPKDSLLKFNSEIVSKYSSGLIFKTISNDIGKESLSYLINNSFSNKINSSSEYFKNQINLFNGNKINYFESLLKNDKPLIENINNKKGSNYKINYKPFKLKLGKDVEDPRYNHIYITPIFSYKNIYDGFTVGTQINNKSIFKKEFNYKIKPLYAVNSKKISGSAYIFKSINYRKENLFLVNYGLYANLRSYDNDSRVKIFSPFISLNFRDNDDLRSNKLKTLMLRGLKISHDGNIESIPEYEIFNIKYSNMNTGLLNSKKWYIDYQYSNIFSKISFNYQIKKMFKNNREFNFRLFSGYFTHNKLNYQNNYFDYSLDRPTDYLYDYYYYGRSEDRGILSQQIIMGEGGFKSKIDNPFSNNFITTINMSSTIWKNFLLYTDIGILNSIDKKSLRFVYDSGIRFNIIENYFEIYFPIKSTNGYEIKNSNYEEKIRFLFTFEPDVLLGLFRRKWY